MAGVTFKAMHRVLWDRRGFRYLWLSNVVSNLGDWLSMVALAVLVVREAGTGLALAVLFMLHTLPNALVAPWSGTLADRFDRRTIMVGTHVLRGALTLGMALAAAGGRLALVEILLGARVVVSAFFHPAARAAVPRLVEPEEVRAASALQSLSWSVLFAAGMGLGGIIASVFGPVTALIADAATYGVAGLLLFGVPSIKPRIKQSGSATATETPAFREAWHHTVSYPGAWRSVWGKAPLAIAGAGGWVAMNLAAARGATWSWTTRSTVDPAAWVLDGAMIFGLMQAVRGIGTGVGPLVLRRFGGLSHVGVDTGSFVVIALFGLLIAGSQAPLAILALLPVLLGWGMFTGHNWVETTSEIAINTPDALQGRVNALDMLLLTFGQGIGCLVGGLVIDRIGIDPATGAYAAASLGLVVWALANTWPVLAKRLAPATS